MDVRGEKASSFGPCLRSSQLKNSNAGAVQHPISVGDAEESFGMTLRLVLIRYGDALVVALER